MTEDGGQNRTRKVVSFTISPEADERLWSLARALKASRSVVVELLVLAAKGSTTALERAAQQMKVENQDRRYAGRYGRK